MFGDGIGSPSGGVDVVNVDEAVLHFGWGVEPDGLEVEGVGVGEREVGDVGGAPGGVKGGPRTWLGGIERREDEGAEKGGGEAGPLMGPARDKFGEAGSAEDGEADVPGDGIAGEKRPGGEAAKGEQFDRQQDESAGEGEFGGGEAAGAVSAGAPIGDPGTEEEEEGADEADGRIEKEHAGIFGRRLPEVLGVVLPAREARAEGGENPRGVEEEGSSAEEQGGVGGTFGCGIAEEGGDEEDREEEDGVVVGGDGESQAGEESEVRAALPGQAR